jgi:hypothetical protein
MKCAIVYVAYVIPSTTHTTELFTIRSDSKARTIKLHFGGHPVRTTIAIAIALLSATAAQGQSVTKYAVSGLPLKLDFAASVNPDCSSIGRPTVRLSRAPEHGHATVTQATDFPRFPPSNIRSECNRRRVAGAAINYVSQRGFIGTDYVEAEIIFASGSLRHESFTINVR